MVLACVFFLPAPLFGQALPAASASTPGAFVPSAHEKASIGEVAVPLAFAAALLEDRHIDEIVRAHRSHQGDRLANALDPLGRAQYILPLLAGSYLVSLGAHRHDDAHSILRIGIAYLAADAVEAMLKPAVGRHRPDSTERPFLFHPFKNDEQWHSFPSAHATHAFALANAISIETDSRWLHVALFSTAALVAAQRIYVGAHWSSDVIASAFLAVDASRIAERFARRRLH